MHSFADETSLNVDQLHARALFLAAMDKSLLACLKKSHWTFLSLYTPRLFLWWCAKSDVASAKHSTLFDIFAPFNTKTILLMVIIWWCSQSDAATAGRANPADSLGRCNR